MSKSILLHYFPMRLKTFISLVLLSFLLCSGISLTANSSQDDSEEFVEDHSHADIQRGERFFKGFLPITRDFESCVSCHNIYKSDTLNWNPSAMDIAVKFAGKDFSEFQSAVMEPDGVKMEASHKDFKIEEVDLKKVKLYLDDLALTGPPPTGPTITQIMLFILLGLLITFALLDLIFFHKIKYRVVSVLILVVALGFQVKMVATAAIDLGRSQNYEPDQPIKFSHKIHAGQNKIDCKYCHFTVENSKSAGIPPMDLCLNCHNLVREGTRSGKFEIAKVIEANEKQMPVEWIRVHNLPDHVFFSHAQHVNAGKLDCIECHGDVIEMDVIRQVEDLSMGWCIDCHRTKEVQFASNSFYESYEKLHEQVKSGQIDKVTVDMIGGTDCMKCHY